MILLLQALDGLKKMMQKSHIVLNDVVHADDERVFVLGQYREDGFHPADFGDVFLLADGFYDVHVVRQCTLNQCHLQGYKLLALLRCERKANIEMQIALIQVARMNLYIVIHKHQERLKLHI